MTTPSIPSTKSYTPAAEPPTITYHEPETPSSSQAQTDTRIGKFEVRRQLGRGGQGSAYLAFDPDLKRHVVLKLYRSAVTPEQQDTVLREGQALARVRSCYVAQCYGVERCDGVPYLVMEYIPGQNLHERHRKQPLDVKASLAVIAHLAEGLAAVHACGLLHRDLKPGNVIIGDDGVPRLVDFGLAATLASDALRGLSGTLAYMAPEQARGEFERIDARTDLFGLGAILYELLTGQPPYHGTNHDELLAAAREGDIVPPRDRNRALSEAVNDLCMKCLAKDPSQRYGSALELKAAVEACGPPRRRWFRAILFTAAALVILFTAVDITGVWMLGVFSPGGSPFATSPQPEPPRHPDGRLLRQQFPVTVQLVGGVGDPAGTVRLTEGERVEIRVEVGQDSYVGVWWVDDKSNVVQLFPNEFDREHLLRKGQPRSIPGDAQYAIKATPSSGREYVHVFATTRFWEPIGGPRSGPFNVFATPEDRNRLQELWRQLGDDRGLKVEPIQPGLPERPRVSEAVLPFVVGKR